VLYDAFISHASEDKESFVRPLAELLRDAHIEVWYDEFSMQVGDSLRRSIDRGLAQSRFGIVVLSPSFFAKQWSQWELDGLVARQNSSPDDVILPIWHNVERDDVIAFSPPIADRVAVPTSIGLEAVVNRLAEAIRPRGSTLVIARDLLIAKGLSPPVISDDWWLDMAAEAESNPMENTFQSAMGWGRWGFPLPPESTSPQERGLRIASAALQTDWINEANKRSISQVSRPEEVHSFIQSMPGLLEACAAFPNYAVAYAPQLAIPGLGGPIQLQIDELADRLGDRSRHARDILPLRYADDTDDTDVAGVACNFVQGEIHGPETKFYSTIDYVVWLLSGASEWLPVLTKNALTRGLIAWPVWLWHKHDWRYSEDFGFEDAEATGALEDRLYRARSIDTFKVTRKIRADIEHRFAFTAELLGLPETGPELADRFLQAGYIEGYFEDRNARRSR